jgi:hypothetical protein
MLFRYQDLLDEARRREIVVELTNLHEEFLAHATNDATTLPYFEGDYVVMEVSVMHAILLTSYGVVRGRILRGV